MATIIQFRQKHSNAYNQVVNNILNGGDIEYVAGAIIRLSCRGLLSDEEADELKAMVGERI